MSDDGALQGDDRFSLLNSMLDLLCQYQSSVLAPVSPHPCSELTELTQASFALASPLSPRRARTRGVLSRPRELRPQFAHMMT
jgi:hypothetical protein